MENKPSFFLKTLVKFTKNLSKTKKTGRMMLWNGFSLNNLGICEGCALSKVTFVLQFGGNYFLSVVYTTVSLPQQCFIIFKTWFIKQEQILSFQNCSKNFEYNSFVIFVVKAHKHMTSEVGIEVRQIYSFIWMFEFPFFPHWQWRKIRKMDTH